MVCTTLFPANYHGRDHQCLAWMVRAAGFRRVGSGPVLLAVVLQHHHSRGAPVRPGRLFGAARGPPLVLGMAFGAAGSTWGLLWGSLGCLLGLFPDQSPSPVRLGLEVGQDGPQLGGELVLGLHQLPAGVHAGLPGGAERVGGGERVRHTALWLCQGCTSARLAALAARCRSAVAQYVMSVAIVLATRLASLHTRPWHPDALFRTRVVFTDNGLRWNAATSGCGATAPRQGVRRQPLRVPGNGCRQLHCAGGPRW